MARKCSDMFNPLFIITPKIASDLMKIEAIRQEFKDLPITATMLSALRETARLESIHYSTKIEGNRLTQVEVADVIFKSEHFPGRERDEKEVMGYYVALGRVEQIATQKKPVTEDIIKTLHALVMAGGSTKVQPTPYRDGQNVIRDASTRKIVYMPPEANNVPELMADLVEWLKNAAAVELPYPLIAGIAHYQFATIHPYYDGNGRTARLLATLILHGASYGLKGIYSLEEYYAKTLMGYYQALDIGSSHNYYMGRAEANITPWLDYFCSGMVESFEKVKKQSLEAYKRGDADGSVLLQKLNARQRKVISLFKKSTIITAHDIQNLFGLTPRTARALCQLWVKEDFLVIVDPAKKTRKYALSKDFAELLKEP
jgi:Fic family protein